MNSANHTAPEERFLILAPTGRDAELTAALADTRKPLSAAQRSEAEEVLARAEQFVAVYHVTLDPPDAELRIEGQPARLQDGQLRFDPGDYAVSARAPGYEEHRSMLRPEAGARAELPIHLVRVPVQVEPPAPPVQQPVPAATRRTPRAPTANRAMVWTGAATLAVGVAADAWSWYAFTVRRARAETLVDASDDDYEQARETWIDARAPLIGATITGAALTTTGVELLVLGAPNERLPWWLAGLSAGVGAGLATWASVDIVQGKCSSDDARLCAMQAQSRERGTLVLAMSAPLFALPLTKLIRSTGGEARHADAQLAALAGGLAVRGRW